MQQQHGDVTTRQHVVFFDNGDHNDTYANTTRRDGLRDLTTSDSEP